MDKATYGRMISCVMKLIVICCFLFTRLGSCALHMRCGNFLNLTSNPTKDGLNITVTDYTKNSSVLRCDNLKFQNFSSFKKVEGEVFNVTYAHGDLVNTHLEVVSTYDHHGNISVIVYGNNDNDAKVWLFTGPKKPSHPGIDKAELRIFNNLPYPVNYSELHGDCYKCTSYQLGVLYPGEDRYLKVDAIFEYTLIFVNQSVSCRSGHYYIEHSHYYINMSHVDMSQIENCHPIRTSKGDDPYLSILWVFCFLIVLTIAFVVPCCFINHFKLRKWFYMDPTDRQIAKDLGSPKATLGSSSDSHAQLVGNKSILVLSESRPLLSTPVGGTSNKKERLRSLDCFRGFSLVLMIFVNYGGGDYWFFNHSKWNASAICTSRELYREFVAKEDYGLTVADLVFPWFMWIMGVSIVFSFRGRKDKGIIKMLYQIVRRTIILFGLGLFLNNGYNLQHWRIPGVLQRFAVSYFVVAITELLSSILYRRCKIPTYRYVLDILHNWIQLLVATCFIALHLLITFFLPLDNGCPSGYLGPGGIGDEGKYEDCTGGAARKIDLKILGINHIYQHPTCKELYHTGPYDPEGILGALNSIALCFLGLQAGKILAHYPSHKGRILRFFIWGIPLGLAGGILATFKLNGGWIPINKNLWSLSFILVMGGTAFFLLSVFYFFIDALKWWNGVPFIYPGMNSILVYCGSELLEDYFPFSWNRNHDTHLSLLASNVIGVGLWILIAYYCYRLRFFVKI